MRERDSIISRVRDQIAIAQKSRRRESAQISRSRAVQSGTAAFKSEIRTFGTFPKVVSAGFWAVLCTEIKGTAGHEFQESLLKKEAVQQAVQQHLLLVFFFCLLHTFLCDLSDGF